MQFGIGGGVFLGLSVGLERDAIGDAVEPAAQRFAVADAAGLAHEDEKRGLEGVLDGLILAQHLPAHMQHHARVTPQQ